MMQGISQVTPQFGKSTRTKFNDNDPATYLREPQIKKQHKLNRPPVDLSAPPDVADFGKTDTTALHE